MKKNENTMKSPFHSFVIRLFLNQITVSIIGFLGAAIALSQIVSGESSLESTVPYFIISSILSLLLLAVFSYSAAWRVGQREYNLVKYSHIELDMRRGIKAGVFAQIPGFLFGAVASALYFAGYETPHLWLKFFYFPFWWLFQLHDRPYMFLIALVFVPLMSNWGYRYGYAFISLRQKIIYQDPRKDEKKKARDKRLR